LRAKRSNPERQKELDCFVASAPRNDEGHGNSCPQKIFFIIFIDAMFTILFERPFTNSFDAARETPAGPCV
jgi:hypothetical protein